MQRLGELEIGLWVSSEIFQRYFPSEAKLIWKTLKQNYTLFKLFFSNHPFLRFAFYVLFLFLFILESTGVIRLGGKTIILQGHPRSIFGKYLFGCSEDDLRSRMFGTFVVKFLACPPLLGFSNT